nr:zinc finger BED domain-containing protein RICESLEEPER 2-like [Ipomoea batatas]
MSYASYNTVDQYSSPSVGSSDLPIDMAEGNEANVDLIGLECDAGKDVTKEVEDKVLMVFKVGKYDQARIREVISHMIMVHELPFSFVEYDLFNIVMQTASPYYERISRTTTTKDCWSTYEIEKKRVQGLLKLVDKISITTDIWTSNQNIQYMVITAHFVDLDSMLQKRVLNFVEVLPPHTGTCVCDAIYKCLQEWSIEEKVWTITVDNASYNDATVRLLHDSLSFHTNLPLDGKLFHIRCCAHILNILVQDGLSEIKSIIGNVRDSVKYISASPQRLHSFNEICKQLQVPSKKLVLDCCTRWNATFAMLSCALDFKQVFPRYQLRDPNYNCLPSDDDWQRVEEICSLLVHFNEVTQITSGSEYPTSNLFLPELYNIKEILCQKAQRGGGETASFRLPEVEVETEWRQSTGSLARLVQALYEATRQIAIVRDSLYGLYKIYLDKYAATSKENDFQAMDTSENCVATTTWKGKGLVVETGRSKFEKFVRNVETVQNVKSELDTYLQDESTFSAGGRVIDTYRASLGTNTVQMLLCGSDWLRNLHNLKRKVKCTEDVKTISLE